MSYQIICQMSYTHPCSSNLILPTCMRYIHIFGSGVGMGIKCFPIAIYSLIKQYNLVSLEVC